MINIKDLAAIIAMKLVLLMGVSMAHAGTTGSVVLSGTVAPSTAIAVAPTANAQNLDLSASPSDLNVASVTEMSNTFNGYKVTLSSTNDGVLKSGSIEGLAYTAKYDGQSVNLKGVFLDEETKAQFAQCPGQNNPACARPSG